MVSIVQTIGVIAAALVSAYAVWASEANRWRDARRAPVERVLEAALRLTEEAVKFKVQPDQGAALEVAKRRLRAEIQIAGVTGFKDTELMAREQTTAAEIASQSEVALLEIG